MEKTYIEFVREVIEQNEIGKPIYVHEIASMVASTYKIPLSKANGAASLAFKRIMDGKIISNLRCYQKGIYYRTVSTPFGESKIDKEQLIEDKYLKNDCGYESGPLLLHRLGLTTQIPKERHLVSNNAKNCARLDKKLGVIVHPGKLKVDSNNKQYLEILDALDSIDKTPVDVEPYEVIGQYIKELNLEYAKLLGYADNYYSKNTILQLAHVAKEVL